jgi:hypothetical protein
VNAASRNNTTAHHPRSITALPRVRTLVVAEAVLTAAAEAVLTAAAEAVLTVAAEAVLTAAAGEVRLLPAMAGVAEEAILPTSIAAVKRS